MATLKTYNTYEKLKAFLYLPRNAWLLTSTSTLWSIGAAMANPYQTLYFAALGTSALDIGILVGYGTGVTILALLIGGYITDTVGRRKVIVVFSWISVAGAAIYALIDAPIFIVIPLTVASIASVYTPAFNAVMFDSIEPGDRIRGFSVFSAINTIPSVFAPTLGGVLMAHYGILYGVKFAYVASAVFGAAAVTIRTKSLQETYIVRPQGRKPFFTYVKDSFISGIRATRRSDSIVKRLLLYTTLAGIGTSPWNSTKS